MDGITVQGRQIRDPAVTVTTDGNGAHVRADVPSRPEVWVEIHITPDALTKLAEDVKQAGKKPGPPDQADDQAGAEELPDDQPGAPDWK